MKGLRGKTAKKIQVRQQKGKEQFFPFCIFTNIPLPALFS